MKDIIFVFAPAGSGKTTNIKCLYNHYKKKNHKLKQSDIRVYDMDDELFTNKKLCNKYKYDIKKFIEDSGGKSAIIKIFESGDTENINKISQTLGEIQGRNMRGKGLLSKKNEQLSQWIKKDEKIIVIDGGMWKQMTDELCGNLHDKNSEYVHLARESGYNFVLFFIYLDLNLAKHRVINRFTHKINSGDYTARLPNLKFYDKIYTNHTTYIKKLIQSNCMDTIIAVDNTHKVCNFVSYKNINL